MRILITSGPTREYLDAVRFLSNPSSGRFGRAIAVEARARGHEVVFISGPVELAAPDGAQIRNVVSAEEMLAAAMDEFPSCDAAIMAAAVCDYRPACSEQRKLPKQQQRLTLQLVPTPDICATLGERKGNRVVIGFAMEDHDHQAHAESKLRRKNCDAIVLNSVSTAGADAAEIQILLADGGWQTPARGNKTDLARTIVDLVEKIVIAKRPIS